MAKRGSALGRVALRQAALMWASAMLLLAGAYVAVRQELLREARAQVDAVSASLIANSDWRLNDLAIQVARRTVEARIEAPSLHLALVDARGNCPLDPLRCPVGTLRYWPDDWALGGPVRRRLSDREGTIMVRVDRDHRLGTQLLVGRDLTALDSLERGAFPLLAAGGLLVTLSSALFGYFSAQQMLKRVRAINVFCGELGDGNLTRRLPVAGSDEFAELAEAMNGMLDRIGHLMSVVQRVADHAAHDLRTPLQLIRLDLEAALRAAESNASEVMIVSAIERLDAALDRFARLLEIARNEGAGAEGFELIDLAELAHETAAIYRPMAEAADLRLESDLRPIRVLGSPPLLQVLLANLIENAIKFSPAGGRIRIATAPECGALLVVADEGPGIAPEYREQVFMHFMRVRGSEGISGHGLGLAMVRAIANRHRLEVRLDDAAPGLRVELRSLDQVNGDLTETVINARGKFRIDFGRQFSGNNRMKELHS